MRYAIGIDLGGTNIAVGLVDEDYRLLAKDSVRTRAQRPWQEVVADMAALAEKLDIPYLYGGNIVTWFSLLLFRQA